MWLVVCFISWCVGVWIAGVVGFPNAVMRLVSSQYYSDGP